MPGSSKVRNGISRHHVLPLGLSVHLLPELVHIFPRQPEAISSTACVAVVKCEWYTWKFTEDPKVKHTGALGPRRGCPFKDRPSQAKGWE